MLPPESHYQTALRNRLIRRGVDLAKVASEGPEEGRWSHLELLLARSINLQQGILATVIVAAGGKRPDLDPVRTPGSTPPEQDGKRRESADEKAERRARAQERLDATRPELAEALAAFTTE